MFWLTLLPPLQLSQQWAYLFPDQRAKILSANTILLHNMSFKALPVWQAKCCMGGFGICWFSLTGKSLVSRMHLGRFARGLLRKRAGLTVNQSLSQSFSKLQDVHMPWQTEPSGRRRDEKVSASIQSCQAKGTASDLFPHALFTPQNITCPCVCDSLTIQFYRYVWSWFDTQGFAHIWNSVLNGIL